MSAPEHIPDVDANAEAANPVEEEHKSDVGADETTAEPSTPSAVDKGDESPAETDVNVNGNDAVHSNGTNEGGDAEVEAETQVDDDDACHTETGKSTKQTDNSNVAGIIGIEVATGDDGNDQIRPHRAR